jgi:hypothetical protein
MDTITLHENFILLYEFEYPEEPLKKWVRDQESYIGGYHDDWNVLVPVIKKIKASKGPQKWNSAKEIDYLKIIDALGEVDIQQAYEATVAYIKKHKT